MIIQELTNKVKIIFEYSKKLDLKFDRIGSHDRKKVIVNIKLNDGRKFCDDEIEDVIIRLRDDRDE